MDTLRDYLIEFGCQPDEAVTYRNKCGSGKTSPGRSPDRDMARRPENSDGEAGNQGHKKKLLNWRSKFHFG